MDIDTEGLYSKKPNGVWLGAGIPDTFHEITTEAKVAEEYLAVVPTLHDVFFMLCHPSLSNQQSIRALTLLMRNSL